MTEIKSQLAGREQEGVGIGGTDESAPVLGRGVGRTRLAVASRQDKGERTHFHQTKAALYLPCISLRTHTHPVYLVLKRSPLSEEKTAVLGAPRRCRPPRPGNAPTSSQTRREGGATPTCSSWFPSGPRAGPTSGMLIKGRWATACHVRSAGPGHLI